MCQAVLLKTHIQAAAFSSLGCSLFFLPFPSSPSPFFLSEVALIIAFTSLSAREGLGKKHSMFQPFASNFHSEEWAPSIAKNS